MSSSILAITQIKLRQALLFSSPMFLNHLRSIMRCLTYSKNETISIPQEIFRATVGNTQDYHRFIPWCRKSEIQQRISETENYTRLTISFNDLREISYTSHVVISQTDESCTITSVCRDSPLKYLQSVWTITKCSQQSSNVNYFLDFEFDSLVYQLTSSIFLNFMGKSMWDIFLKRATEVNRQRLNDLSHPVKQTTHLEATISDKKAEAIDEASLTSYLTQRPKLKQIFQTNQQIQSQILKIDLRLSHTNNYSAKMNFQIRNMLTHYNISPSSDIFKELF